MNGNGEMARKFRFTQRDLESLPAHDPSSASHQMEYCDSDIVGLRLFVGHTGRRFFYLRYRLNGRKRSCRIGEFPSVSLKEARTRAHELKSMISRGDDPSAERRTKAAIPNFADFALNEYLPDAKLHKRSWRDDELRINKELVPRFGRMQLTAITSRDVQQFHVAVRASHAPATANRYLSLVARMLQVAVEREYIERNPARSVHKFREDNARNRYLSNQEIAKFLEALDSVGNRSMANAFKFLLFTGLRKGEAMTLPWRNVNLENGTVYLEKTKNGRTRSVLLNALARHVLEEMLALRRGDHPYVFPGREPNSPVTNPSKVFAAALKAAGIEGFHCHDLRHTYASLAINSGATLYDVQKLLGHATSQMTQRYAHLADASLRTATENVANQISAVA